MHASQVENGAKRKTSPKTLQLNPHPGEMIKPAELIDLSGVSNLTLSARRLYNALIANAFGPEMGKEGQEFTISLAELRGSHDKNDRIWESVEALMMTLVTVRLPDGTTRRFQLLGGNDMTDPQRRLGTFTYTFDRRLVELLADSKVFGKLDIQTMMAFSTRYALALYEAIARRSRLQFVFSEIFSLEAFRDILGVGNGKLTSFSNLNNRAIRPAVSEVNAYATFGVKIIPQKTGRKVTSVKLGWWQKEDSELRETFAELRRHSAGRRARRDGTVEDISFEKEAV